VLRAPGGGALRPSAPPVGLDLDVRKELATRDRDISALRSRIELMGARMSEIEDGRDVVRDSQIEKRLAAIEARLGSLDRRVEAIELRREASGDVAERLDALEARLTALESARAAAPAASSTSKTAEPDDLRRIKGIGPKFERALVAMGVTTFAQIAGWSARDVERVAAELGIKPERIARAGWTKSAQALAKQG
jgi:predicted flap endonuclease-1-like 5' DNA nuclease